MECGVCLSGYNSEENRPKSLPCGHSLCCTCVNGSLIAKGGRMDCPFCRTPCGTGVKTLDDFPTTFAILSLLSIYEQNNPKKTLPPRERDETNLHQQSTSDFNPGLLQQSTSDLNSGRRQQITSDLNTGRRQQNTSDLNSRIISLPPVRFHSVCGKRIQLDEYGSVARRVGGLNNGITFSNRPVQIGECVYIRLLEINKTFALSSLSLGFTSQDPTGFRGALPKNTVDMVKAL